MGHKCFISFKTQDMAYKRRVQNLGIDMIDKSLDVPINSTDEDYIMRKIREDYLSDSTVTLFLIGQYSAENNIYMDQTYIKRELQASLYNGTWNTRSGILGIVLPDMIDRIYKGREKCTNCQGTHNIVMIDNDTTIKEFWYNYYLPKNYGCAWADDDRYCVLAKWSEFEINPEKYIDEAYGKRTHPIANKVKVRP